MRFIIDYVIRGMQKRGKRRMYLGCTATYNHDVGLCGGPL